MALLLLAAGGEAACRSGASSAPARRALERLPLEPCRREGIAEELLCGSLEVPENRSRPDSARISLAVVVVPALADAPAPEPWFGLEGGPGDSAVEMAGMYVNELPGYRRHRDVVLVDQRGTGESSPLTCPELDDPEDPLLPRFHLDSVERCRDALAATRDLTGYSTTESVEDLEAVRAWLGYERVRLFGFSYGTLVARTWARRHPERVSAMVLWGPVPPSFQRPRFYARDGQRALEGRFEACQAEARCAEAFPDLEGDLGAALARLEAEPAPVEWRRPGRDPVEVRVTRAAFGEGLWAALSHRAGEVPLAIHAAARGDLGAFERLANDEGRFIGRDRTEAMYLSVTCAEETLRFEAGERDPGDAERLLGEGRLLRQRAACEAWPPRFVEPGFHAPFESDVPALVISGELDPVTPPDPWGERMLEGLSRGRLVTVPRMGHSARGMENEGCVDALAIAFGERPDPEALDASCVLTMRPPPFSLPES